MGQSIIIKIYLENDIDLSDALPDTVDIGDLLLQAGSLIEEMMSGDIADGFLHDSTRTAAGEVFVDDDDDDDDDETGDSEGPERF